MHYLWMALVGLVVGALARLIVITMLIGIAGALLAGFPKPRLRRIPEAGWPTLGTTVFDAGVYGYCK